MIHFIYNPDRRDVPTGNYLLDAAKRRGIPISWSPKGVPKGLSPTLIMKIDDGDFDNINYSELYNCPTVWWFIDSHTDFNRGLSIASNFDYVFCAHKDGSENLNSHGVFSDWLPVGSDPVYHSTIYKNLDDRPIDVGFSGSIKGSNWNPERPQLLSEISERFKNSMIMETTKGQNSTLCSSCKVIFNQCVNNDINMRFFEAISSGSILVTKRIEDNGMENMLVSDSVLFYDTNQEAIEHIEYALLNTKKLDASAKNLAQHYHKNHSYDHRLFLVLNSICKKTEIKLSTFYPQAV